MTLAASSVVPITAIVVSGVVTIFAALVPLILGHRHAVEAERRDRAWTVAMTNRERRADVYPKVVTAVNYGLESASRLRPRVGEENTESVIDTAVDALDRVRGPMTAWGSRQVGDLVDEWTRELWGVKWLVKDARDAMADGEKSPSELRELREAREKLYRL